MECVGREVAQSACKRARSPYIYTRNAAYGVRAAHALTACDARWCDACRESTQACTAHAQRARNARAIRASRTRVLSTRASHATIGMTSVVVAVVGLTQCLPDVHRLTQYQQHLIHD